MLVENRTALHSIGLPMNSGQTCSFGGNTFSSTI